MQNNEAKEQLHPKREAGALKRWGIAYNASNTLKQVIYQTQPDVFLSEKSTSRQAEVMPLRVHPNASTSVTPLGETTVHLMADRESQAEASQHLREDLARENVVMAYEGDT